METTSALPRQKGGPAAVLRELAPSFVVGLGLLVVVAELAQWMDWPFLASVAQSRLVLAGLLVVIVTIIATGVRAVRSSAAADAEAAARPPSLVAWAPAVPAAVMAVYAVASRLLPESRRLKWFLGGDNVRHLVMTAAERSAGFLDYSVDRYPRGWHTLMATLWSATGAQPNARGLESLIDLMSTSLWLLYALLSLATGLCAQALCARNGLRVVPAALAGLVAAALTLVPTLVSNYLVLGFHNSVLGALLLAVALREVLVRAASRTAVVVTGSCILVMAHTWQLLVPGVLLAFGVVAVAQLRPELVGPPEPLAAIRTNWRGAFWIGATVVVVVVAALPSAVAVATKIGIGHASEAGVDAPVPFTLLALAMASSVVVLVRRRRDVAVVATALAVVGTALSGLVLAARVGVSPMTYYPSKMLWHGTVLGLVPTTMVGAQLLGDLGARAKGLARVGWLFASSAIGVVVVFSLVNPMVGASGAWPSPHGDVVLRAVTTPGAARAQVVWTGDAGDDAISRILLDFYRVGQTAVRTAQDRPDVATECLLLAESGPPAVLSTKPPAEVRERYACVPGVRSLLIRPDLP